MSAQSTNDRANRSALFEHFKFQWSTGTVPDIRHYLDQLSRQDPQTRYDLFFQLVAYDMECRWRSREDRPIRDQIPLRPSAEDYLRQFPEFGDPSIPPWEMLKAELQTRHKWGDSSPDLNAYAKKYPQWEEQLTAISTSSEAQDDTQTIETEVYKQYKNSDKKQIGPYTLLRQLGEGGMGTVWLAEQYEPIRRRVALKIIKSGLDSQQVITRFEAERQALAMMDHPNIAKVLEAGTTDVGTPYFVMELVMGQPLTLYCEQNQLTLKERLNLFLQACHAIQHSHQKGLIHRDIKPSNILVTEVEGEPTVKVIDFGLAKALQPTLRLTDQSMYTEFGQVLGTVRYMSPEQAGLNDMLVDTRSDVYSLGVVFYELLTGSTPLKSDTMRALAIDRVLAAIREEETPPPSQRLNESKEVDSNPSWLRGSNLANVKKILRKELDWIALKALEKNRNRRYESVSELASDVSRYLNDEPVLARPPTFGYRATKFIRKNRVAMITIFAGVSALLLLLAGYGLITLNGLYQRAEIAAQVAISAENVANEQRQEAETERSRAQELATDLSQERDTLKVTNEKLDMALSDVKAANQQLEKNAKTIQVQNTELERQSDHLKTALVTVEQERNRASFASMFASINLAKANIEESNVAGALNLLASIPNNYRGWEWRHLLHLCHLETPTLSLDTQASALAIAPDGSRVAVGLGEQGVILYQGLPTQNNVTSQAISTKGFSVHTLQFSPDGSRLWISCGGTTPAVWTVDHLGNRQLVDWLFTESQAPPQAVMKMAFSTSHPDEGFLATTNAIYWINITNKSSKRIFTAEQVADIAWSIDGKHLVVAAQKDGARFLATMTATSPFAIQQRQEFSYKVSACEPLADGRIAFTTWDCGLHIWDPSSSRNDFALQLPARITDLSYDPATQELAAALSDSSIQVFGRLNLSNQYCLAKVLRGHKGSVIALATNSQLGRTLSISEDRTLKSWDVNAYEDEESITDTTAILCSGIAFNGRYLVTGNRMGVTRLYEKIEYVLHAPMPNQRKRETLKRSGHSSPSLANNRWRAIPLDSPQLESPTTPIVFCGIDTDAQEAFSVAKNGEVCWWDLESGKVIDKIRLSIEQVQCGTQKGDLVAIGGQGGELQILKNSSRSVLLSTQLSGAVDAICLPKDTSRPVLVATSRTQQDNESNSIAATELQLIDMNDGKPKSQPFAEHQGRYTSLAISDAGNLVAAGSSDSGIRLWEVADPTNLPMSEPKLLAGHHTSVTSLAFTPDSKRLISGDNDGRLELWFIDRPVIEVETRGITRPRPVAELHVQQMNSLSRHRDAVTSIEFSPDEDQIISTGLDGQCIIRLADDVDQALTNEAEVVPSQL